MSVLIGCRAGCDPDYYFNLLCDKCQISAEWFSPPVDVTSASRKWGVLPNYVGQYEAKRKYVKDFLKLFFNAGVIEFASW